AAGRHQARDRLRRALKPQAFVLRRTLVLPTKTTARIRSLWLIACVLVLAGCSSSHSASGRPPAFALNLVGEWNVSATGAEANTVLLLGDDLEVWTSCGVLYANWAADTAGQFAAIMYSASDECFPPSGSNSDMLLPTWLAHTSSFMVTGQFLPSSDADAASALSASSGSSPRSDAASARSVCASSRQAAHPAR